MSYATIQINLTDIDDDTLIEEIENRDYQVMLPGQTDEDVEALHRTLDDINSLLDSFYAWKDGGLKNEWFESELKSFFESTIDKKVL